MGIARGAAVVVALVAGAVLAVPAAAQDGGGGLIVFQANGRLEVIAPDGTGVDTMNYGTTPALSPTGEHLAFVRPPFVYERAVRRSEAQLKSQRLPPPQEGIVVRDLRTGEEVAVPGSHEPTWAPDGRRLAFSRPAHSDCQQASGNREIFVTDLFAAEQVTETPCVSEDSPEFSPDGQQIVYSAAYRDTTSDNTLSRLVVRDLLTGDERTLTDGSDMQFASTPSWSPDGTTIAFAGSDGEISTVPATGGAVQQLSDSDDGCVAGDPDWSPDGSLLVVGYRCGEGSEPTFDLALLDAGGGTPVPVVGTPEGDLYAPSWSPATELPPAEFGRVDGGGAADPVAQTVELSKALFDDGQADRVVLATAERFPDALAGSALAGEDGPILVTPFADTLDPRVQAEITRVTGGDGIVLTLGGVAAVTEPAAAQARAAAGDNQCGAPFPDSCRYAGIGREHTATLIADTVVAEHTARARQVGVEPPRPTALLARGDEFADAITGGAYAANAGTPILLTPSTMLNDHTDQWLRANPAITQVVVLGGVAAVDDPTMAAVPVDDKRRVFGAERTATAAAIANDLWGDAATGGITLVNVRHPDGWHTALSGAVASARRNAPQLGVENPPAEPTQATLDAARALGGPLLVLGDPTLVTDIQAQAVATTAW